MIEKCDDSDFRKLKLYVARLQTVVNELESLEDFVDVDYSDIKTDIGYCTYYGCSCWGVNLQMGRVSE